MTIDEELNQLESNLRRLKIEYEIYFSNAHKKPPAEIEWRVLTQLRKFSDGAKMNFSQRYRYNEMAQRYAIYSDLWRKKSRIREEGYRRPQDAILSIQGVRQEVVQQNREHGVYGVSPVVAGLAAAARPEQPFVIQCSGGAEERSQVETLYHALWEAKKKTGKSMAGDLDSFLSFVNKKSDQIRKKYSCQVVEYMVEIVDGEVRLKAKAKT